MNWLLAGRIKEIKDTLSTCLGAKTNAAAIP